MMNIQPLNDCVLVRRVKEEERSRGGIIIPDSAREKSIVGNVVDVGKGRVTEGGKVLPPDVKKGDRVLFSQYGGTDVKVGDEDFLILREGDILGIVESGLV